jgi:hypothetical protein
MLGQMTDGRGQQEQAVRATEFRTSAEARRKKQRSGAGSPLRRSLEHRGIGAATVRGGRITPESGKRQRSERHKNRREKGKDIMRKAEVGVITLDELDELRAECEHGI